MSAAAWTQSLAIVIENEQLRAEVDRLRAFAVRSQREPRALNAVYCPVFPVRQCREYCASAQACMILSVRAKDAQADGES